MIFPEKYVKLLEAHHNNLKEEDVKLHREITKGILTIEESLIKTISREDSKIFRMIRHMYHHGYLTDKDKNQALEKLKKLHQVLSSNPKTQEENVQIVLLLEEMAAFLEHEESYLEYRPGAEGKEYIKIIDLLKSKNQALTVNREKLEYENGRLYYNGKEIQGIKIKSSLMGVTVEITGEHYSNEKTIREIHQRRSIIPSTSNVFSIGLDPYCYILENGRLIGKSISEIRKITGARNADSFISIKVSLPANMVWIRVKKGNPAKFALESKNLQIIAPKSQKGFRVNIKGKVEYLAA